MHVTVIIPTYNRLSYLEEAIASILNQTYQDWTTVIVNDYPPDKKSVTDLIAKFDDSRLVLINHDRTLGGNVARNTGIKQAKGEIIAFLDDDDIWLPNKLASHVKQHQVNPQAGAIFSGVIQRWEEVNLPSKTTLAKLPTGDILEQINLGLFCPHTTSCVTVLRECFLKCGMFDETLKSFQDWDMWFRIAQNYPFDCVSEALIIFRQHLGDRTSQSVDRRLEGLSQILTKWESQLINLPQFSNIFTKEVYISHINKLILHGRRSEAVLYWQKLLKLSRTKKDILQAIKLMLLFIFGVEGYKPLLQGVRSLKLNR